MHEVKVGGGGMVAFLGDRQVKVKFICLSFMADLSNLLSCNKLCLVFREH